MKIIHKTSAISFYMIHSGFSSFKNRIREELSATSGINLDDVLDEQSLYNYYRSGETPDFVAASICGCSFDE